MNIWQKMMVKLFGFQYIMLKSSNTYFTKRAKPRYGTYFCKKGSETFALHKSNMKQTPAELIYQTPSYGRDYWAPLTGTVGATINMMPDDETEASPSALGPNPYTLQQWQTLKQQHLQAMHRSIGPGHWMTPPPITNNNEQIERG